MSERTDPTRPVVLIGIMGAGKSAVGRRVAARLGRPFLDTDDLVVERAEMSIPEVFEQDGELMFRALESESLRHAVASEPTPLIAAGGGVVLSDANCEILREYTTVVWLDAPPEVLAERVGDGADRPLLSGGGPGVLDRLRAIDANRRARYEAVADVVVDATAGVDEVAEAVAAALAGGDGGGG